MNICACGNPADSKGSRCDRCAALQTLGLEADATAEQIKDAYRLLVKVWHPDRFQNDRKLKDETENKLKAINAAYVLLTSPAASKVKRAQPRYASASEARAKAAGETTPAEPVRPAGAAPGPRSKLRFGLKYLAALGVVSRLCIFAVLIGVSALVLNLIDSQLASDPATASVYLNLRSGMIRQLDASRRKIWDGIGERFNSLIPHSSAAQPAPPPISAPEPPQQKQRSRQPARPAPATHALLPFITVGLTRDEVLATAGVPTSASEDKLVYQGSELYLKDDKVVGWRIDPAGSPLRVKLWPDAPVDPDLDSFTVGSTKNEVLVVQGTPTTFSENTFGYGRSEVYFQHNRVASWKEDPTSIRLRAVRR